MRLQRLNVKKQFVAYQEASKAKSDLERTELNKEKTGVATGALCNSSKSRVKKCQFGLEIMS